MERLPDTCRQPLFRLVLPDIRTTPFLMSFLSRTLLLVTLALPALTQAADDLSANGATLTREQIEQCLIDRKDVVARNQELTAQKAALDERGTALLNNESRLKEAHESLRTQLSELQVQEDELKRRVNDMAAYLNQAAVVKKASTAYNERVQRYDAEVRAHQQLLDQFNADVVTLNQQLDVLNVKARNTDRRCVKASVRRADLDAAKTAVEEKPRTVLTPETRVLP
jgi:chromosome segregation ATPase